MSETSETQRGAIEILAYQTRDGGWRARATRCGVTVRVGDLVGYATASTAAALAVDAIVQTEAERAEAERRERA